MKAISKRVSLTTIEQLKDFAGTDKVLFVKQLINNIDFNLADRKELSDILKELQDLLIEKKNK
jgi:hypothetical protein